MIESMIFSFETAPLHAGQFQPVTLIINKSSCRPRRGYSTTGRIQFNGCRTCKARDCVSVQLHPITALCERLKINAPTTLLGPGTETNDTTSWATGRRDRSVAT